ncbi:MAG: hypothetical protein IT379_07645 [Deltaproteobacteria bacterium]|nr:hypothetical protein [Deltaproteobacteria bacterium]
MPAIRVSTCRRSGCPHAREIRSITQADVRANLTIIARPPMTDGSYGVYPDTARNALKIQGTRRAGEPLPWADWAQEFADNLPDAIRDALAKATPTTSGSIDDPTFKARLTDRFGARWRSLRYVADPRGTERVNPDETTGPFGTGQGGGSIGGGGGNLTGPAGPQSAVPPTVARVTNPTGSVMARSAQIRGGLPEYEWKTMADIEPDRLVAAAWCPPSRVKPSGVVQLARDFPAILEVKKFWRAQYADHHGNQIDRIVEEVYGEAMVARIAHSESLASHRSWGRTKVEEELRSEAALTMSVLGLLSEDHIISARLAGTLGRRRS